MFIQRADTRNFSNVERQKKQIKYIVIHYDANKTATARNNLSYFSKNYVGASAHFFVDENEICCSVPILCTAWHCGAKEYKHKECRNNNSIGVEMCSRFDDDYYIPELTLKRCAEFVAQKMLDFGVDIDHVIRHYDVTGKLCPKPLVDEKKWNDFKRLVMSYCEGEKDDMFYYEKIEDIPKGEQRETVKKLVERGTIKGNKDGLHLSTDMVRMIVYNNREGLYK